MNQHRRYLSIVLAVCMIIGGWLPRAWAVDDPVDLPAAHMISDLPWHKQITAISCGAGSLEIVFDYWGPDINQKEIADVARTSSSGTWPADIVRTGHFSHLSSAMGSFYPSMVPEAGLTARATGYAAFSHSGNTSWLDDLKALIARDMPVIVLMGYTPDGDAGHYRVVVGYDDTRELIYFSDTWGREIMKPSNFTGVISWSYEDFEKGWSYTDYSDAPYFGAVILPWHVGLSRKGEAAPGSTITIVARITYPCPTPMDCSQFEATSVKATIDLPEGMNLVDRSLNPIKIRDMNAGDTATVSWKVRCDGDIEGQAATVTASGIIEGSMDAAAWAGNTNYYPAYDYTDEIGGAGSLQF